MNDTDWLPAWVAGGKPNPAATRLTERVADLRPAVAAIVEWERRHTGTPEEAASSVVSDAR